MNVSSQTNRNVQTQMPDYETKVPANIREGYDQKLEALRAQQETIVAAIANFKSLLSA